MEEQIEALLAEMRPAFERHNGDIQLDSIDEKEGIVYVRLMGSCKGCPFSHMTLKSGVETMLVQAVLGVKEVRAVNA